MNSCCYLKPNTWSGYDLFVLMMDATSGRVAELYILCQPNLSSLGQSPIDIDWAHLHCIEAQSIFITLEHNIVTMLKGKSSSLRKFVLIQVI